MPQAMLNPYWLGTPEPPAPTVWFRSDFGTTLSGSPAVNGGLVDTWSDKSGNGFNATQATSAQQPTYNTNILNGQPALSFPRSPNQLMTIPSSSALFPPTTTAYSIFTVIKPTNFSNAMVMFEGDTGGGFVQWYIDTSGKQISQNGNPSSPSNTALTSGAWNRIGLVIANHSSGNVAYYLNGAADGTPSVGVSGSVGSIVTSLMGDRPPFVFPLIGSIVEFLFYNRAVSGAEITQIDNYFKARYGL
jgi:hypothetical protein